MAILICYMEKTLTENVKGISPLILKLTCYKDAFIYNVGENVLLC